MLYIHQRLSWPEFFWDHKAISDSLASVRHRQGRLLGRMESLGFALQDEAVLHTLTLDVLKSHEIEGEFLNTDQVRSSIARKLGIDIGALPSADRYVEGVVEMLMDATQRYNDPLTEERLFGWHAALFPTGRSGMSTLTVGNWREGTTGPMQVVSGAMGREIVHFEAPGSERVPQEMSRFIQWFNQPDAYDPVIKAAVAHVWFVTIHPFDDGNGRIARSITDMQLARSDGSPQRFYSMSAQIQTERSRYYAILEKTQRRDLDITEWLHWFLTCLEKALMATEYALASVLDKARYWALFAEKSINNRQNLMLNKLLDGFTGNLTTSKWAKITKVSADTALRDIQNLVEQEVLVKKEAGGRSTQYRLVELD